MSKLLLNFLALDVTVPTGIMHACIVGSEELARK